MEGAGTRLEARSPALPSLNGFRLFAALWIFIYHWRETLAPLALGTGPEWLARLWARMLDQGHVAVSALFCLSGFVLAYNHPRPFRPGQSLRFYVARLARIYPGYVLAFLVGVPLFLERAIRGLPTPTAADAVSYLTMTSAWIPSEVFAIQEPGWAMSAVAFFYLAYPALIAVLAPASPRRLLGLAGLAWAAALVAPAIFVALGMPDTDESLVALLVRYNPALRLGEFALGIAAALWWTHRRPALPGYVAPLALLAFIVVPVAPLPRMLLHNGLLAPLVAVVLVALAGGRGPMPKLLSLRSVSFLGQAGFGVFILQVPMFWVVDAVQNVLGSPRRTVVSFVLTLSLTLLAASVSLLWFERPAKRAIQAAFDRGIRPRSAVPAE